MTRLAVAMPACCSRPGEIRVGYALEALALGAPDLSLDVFLWDEGAAPVLSDRWTRLVVDLLGRRGHRVNYLRRSPSRGVAAARRGLLEEIPPCHDRILLLDDDMVLMPGALAALLDAAAAAEEFGFVQGTKLELDPLRVYDHDINVMNGRHDGPIRRIWFGDAAFQLVRREALAGIRWDVVTRFAEQGLAGEDVAISLMIADRYACYGVSEAVGWHLSLERPRWTWEAASDALQLELLRGLVSADTLRRALPHMARYIE